MTESDGLYVDRRTGAVQREQVFARRLLFWLHNARLGLWLTRVLLRQPLLSKCYGWYHRQPVSRHKIARFVRQMDVDTSECSQPLAAYRSFNEFFIRQLAPGRRPVDGHPERCVSPVDGKLIAIQELSADEPVRIKQHRFNLFSFLRDDALARQFDGGSMLICRLSFADYHHVHFPDSGVPHAPHRIPGSLYAGGPYARRYLIPFYDENVRELTAFDSDHFGSLLIVEVGAFTVGSICQQFAPRQRVSRGDRKGHFELGGSTVVLLFRPDCIRFDADLLQNSQRQLETYVRMGEHVGFGSGSTP